MNTRIVYQLVLWACLAGLLFPAGLSAQDEIDCPEPEGITLPAAAWYVGQGDARAANAQHSLALVDYSCAIEADPANALAYARRAFAYISLGNDEAALADLEESLTLDETLIENYINRGALYARLGNFGLAIGDFTLALSLDPQVVTALNNRAVIHAIEGNFDLALADLEQAVALEPDNPAPYATFGAVYSALAAQNYQRFEEKSTIGEPLLPAGTPGQVLAAVDDSLRTGNYGFWLALLRRGP